MKKRGRGNNKKEAVLLSTLVKTKTLQVGGAAGQSSNLGHLNLSAGKFSPLLFSCCPFLGGGGGGPWHGILLPKRNACLFLTSDRHGSALLLSKIC